MPPLRNLTATISAACLVATNTSALPHFSVLTKCRSSMARLLASTSMARWAISGAWVVASSTCTRTGWRSMLLASASIAWGKVAEKNRFCRFLGNSARMRPSSSSNPSSSRRSASSSTKLFTCDKPSALLPSRSSKRPGVATTMSAPPRKCCICGLMATPPNTTATLGFCGRYLPKAWMVSPTCAASSRVGTRIRLRTTRGVSMGASANCWSSGKIKAAVLPEPVLAEPSTSAPCKIAGMAWRCISVAAV